MSATRPASWIGLGSALLLASPALLLLTLAACTEGNSSSGPVVEDPIQAPLLVQGYPVDSVQRDYPVLRFAVPPNGVEIRYTLDGSVPTNSSALFADSLRIDTSCVFQARGIRVGSAPGPVLRLEYRLRASGLRGFVPDHYLWPDDSGRYVFEGERVAFHLLPEVDWPATRPEKSAEIRYSCDGSEPTRASALYRDSLTLDSSCTMQARLFRSGMEPGPVLRYPFVVKVGELEVVQNPPGEYDRLPVIKIAARFPGTEIHFTVDGSTPTPASPLFRDSLRLDSTCLVQAIGFRAGARPSPLLRGRYSLSVPELQVMKGYAWWEEWSEYPVVKLRATMDSVVIRYTLDGSAPSISSPILPDSLRIDTSCTFSAVGYRRGMEPSQPIRIEYALRAAPPIASIPPARYDSYQNLALGALIPGGSIRYTVDGSPVTESSPLYRMGDKIPLESPLVTVKARTFAKGMEPSSEREWVYRMEVDTLESSDRGGTRWERLGFRLGLACTTPGVEIRYTTDGSAPTANSPLYTDSLLITPAIRDLRARTFTPSQPALAPSPDVVLHWDWLAMGMKTVPGGSFRSGARTIALSGFAIDSTEVTQASFAALMGWDPMSARPDDPDALYKSLLPVRRVTWGDAIRYCNARSRSEGLDTVYTYRLSGKPPIRHYGPTPADQSLSDEQIADVAADFTKNGYRLPTEAEWEYAMRAGAETPFFWGSDSTRAAWSAYAWYEVSYPEVKPVAQRQPNPWGLYDMLGNAHEWVNDWYGESRFGEGDTDPTGPADASLHMSRGGCVWQISWSGTRIVDPELDPRKKWGAPVQNPWGQGLADWKEPDLADTLGFRCVRRL